MGNNRFLEMNAYLKDGRQNRFGVRANKSLSSTKTKTKDCQQFNEEAIDPNQFVLDVLQFFFEERLKEEQLNDTLRDIAARALWAATEGSRAMDLVPRPPMGKPGLLWLVSQVVQIAFRKAQNRCIYEAVRVTVKLSLRSEYEVAKITSGAQSRYTSSFENTSKQVSANGMNLVKKFEGFVPKLYNDPAGHCTIGYGTLVHTGNCNGMEPEEFKGGISEQRASELLNSKISHFGQAINTEVQVSLNQNQFDSLVSFVYNIGIGAFRNSTLLKELNKGNYTTVPEELKKWVKANGQILPGLVNRRAAEAELFQKAETGQSLSYVKSDYSQPLYDTGEHALFGELEHSYVKDRTFIINSVSFTYGQIITMADLFADDEQMMRASADELNRIKKQVAKSIEYFDKKIRKNQSVAGLNPGNTDWQTATDKRYLSLAEDNYEHFAPNTLLKGITQQKGDHKSAWEYFHKKAIDTARQLFLSSGSSPSMDLPLIINAFGDHYLTDAFAAGHQFNKEAIIANFRIMFYNSGLSTLTEEGKAFFRKVASKAFKGKVKDKFSKLETGKSYRILGVPTGWNPNINSPSRFGEFLIQAAEAEPVAIANLAAKALHDKLNNDGITVTSVLENVTWTLTGDNSLNALNLQKVQKAVYQSVENILDPTINGSNINYGAYFKKVWDHTPVLTPDSSRKMLDLIRVYTDPASEVLAQAAAEIIEEQIDIMVEKVVEQGALKPA